MADTIKLKAKLSAYTKGVIPDVSSFIDDAPEDGSAYARQNGAWISIDKALEDVESNVVLVDEGSGLDREEISDKKIKLSVRQWEGKIDEVPDTIEKDKNYYAAEYNVAQLYIYGGTSFSEENEEWEISINGGTAKTTKFDLVTHPLNCKGEYA